MVAPAESAASVNGLYFASETFRSRGIGVDRAARALGRRIPEFKDSCHD